MAMLMDLGNVSAPPVGSWTLDVSLRCPFTLATGYRQPPNLVPDFPNNPVIWLKWRRPIKAAASDDIAAQMARDARKRKRERRIGSGRNDGAGEQV